MGLFLYTTPACVNFKHCETSRWCFYFGCDVQRLLPGVCLFMKSHLLALL